MVDLLNLLPWNLSGHLCEVCETGIWACFEGFRVGGVGFRVQTLGFGVKGWGVCLRVEGLGFRV